MKSFLAKWRLRSCGPQGKGRVATPSGSAAYNDLAGTGAEHVSWIRPTLLFFVCYCVSAFPFAAMAQVSSAPTATVAAAVLPDAPVPESAQTQQQNQSQQSQTQTQSQSPPQTQQNQTGEQPSLGDLGITPSQTQGSAKEQAMLDKRTHMLKVHQTLGLITAIPMAAALITGPMAKAKGRNGQVITEPSQANLDFHAALGSLTAGMYFTTAYYAEFAPKVPGVKKRGAIRVHEALAFVHGPGMILTPILGIMAFRQEEAGEKVHGIASYHGTAATVTALAYGASIVAVSWPIHIKF